ncbi:MAG TPA: hypothetical protein VFY04_06845 [Solirubrobacterales bacterium]|nr:hypothetical protein [Solirubrobacterales bacterium]
MAVLGAALAIAGCGGGDDDETPAPAAPPPAETTALTKEELLAQGDAICAEVNAAAGALASSESAGGPADTAELYTGMVQRLHGLDAPSDDSTGYSDFSAAAEELGQAEGNLELAAQRGDPEGLANAETEASTALSSFQEAASDFGFEQCSEGPSAASAPDGDEPGGVETEEVAPEEVEETEEAPEETEEVAPETGGAGSAEEGGAGGGAEAGGETGGGEGSGGGSSGGIGPG